MLRNEIQNSLSLPLSSSFFSYFTVLEVVGDKILEVISSKK